MRGLPLQVQVSQSFWISAAFGSWQKHVVDSRKQVTDFPASQARYLPTKRIQASCLIMSLSAVSTVELVAAALFVLAVLHTFSTNFFARLAHRHPRHAGLLHLLGEVEVVFGFWAFVLIAAIFLLSGMHDAVSYLEGRNFTEPMFVFAIMVIAASRPILNAVMLITRWLAAKLPFTPGQSMFFLCLSLIPLMGSLITEPAAMTLAALMLKDGYLVSERSTRLKYAALGLLFVNVSIGGTLTHFAAPPVLMVAAKWQWDTWFMLTTFGWKAALAVIVNASVLTWLFRKELAAITPSRQDVPGRHSPLPLILLHLGFLIGVVVFAHHPVVFMGIFLLFLGFAEAYREYQERLILREGLLVAFFLAGLVVLGGLQQWWLQDTLTSVEPTALYFLATALTAVTDNAALTYLASLVQGVSDDFKYAVVAGAVTGGGLTIIANAPNPAGVAILKSAFKDDSINPFALFVAALAPTCVAILAFQVL